ncbi:undecaprenyl phosphate translocase family protein [Borrelia crocidurae]|uniref:Integral membrane protein n=1 Tax=Borrelia crocidurae (strain Achema) TaxID=1155096 RepID=I0FDJ4_BORCA|nr:DUF368 domain-containing protein [Borrelia crocidurae]AFI31550.1 hypothetical protein Q7M_771 [Borrelia crocidurae str. Achema]
MGIYIKGLLIGIANIIPGISGGTIALITGIYYNIIYSSTSLVKLKRVKENITFLGKLSLGILTSTTIFAKILKKYILDNATKEMYLNIFFIGLILGSIFTLKKEINTNSTFNINTKINKYLLFISGLLTILFLLILKHHNVSLNLTTNQDKTSIQYYLLLACSGIIGGSAMILPGISGSLILLSLGTYKEIINIIAQIKIIPCIIFSTFTIIGIGITIIIIKKTIEKYLIDFLYLSIGLISGTIIQMIFLTTKLQIKLSLQIYVFSIILFIGGIYINNLLNNKNNPKI